jgi:hypothetical protein
VDTIKIRQQLFDLVKSGKVKTKGRYEVMPFDKIGFHKNHSAMVVPMAALAEMLDVCKAEDFIKEHTDKFDFFLRTKVPRSSRLILMYDDKEELQQNICRYYPCKDGGKLIKIMPPLVEGDDERRLSIESDWNVKTCNDIKDFRWDLDYDYYVNEAEKLVIK